MVSVTIVCFPSLFRSVSAFLDGAVWSFEAPWIKIAFLGNAYYEMFPHLTSYGLEIRTFDKRYYIFSNLSFEYFLLIFPVQNKQGENQKKEETEKNSESMRRIKLI